jgi:hypothetical protein
MGPTTLGTQLLSDLLHSDPSSSGSGNLDSLDKNHTALFTHGVETEEDQRGIWKTSNGTESGTELLWLVASKSYVAYIFNF